MELYHEKKYPQIGLTRYWKDGNKKYLISVLTRAGQSLDGDWWASFNVWTSAGWQKMIEDEGWKFQTMEEAADDMLVFGLGYLNGSET